jgi:hypothetical protein
MVAEIRIYCEGDPLLKPGFSTFFRELRRRAREQRCSFHPIPCGAGPVACRNFAVALRNHARAWNILLINSECPYQVGLAASLCNRYKWKESHAESIYWMVQMMEAWFHADREALKRFYGEGFRLRALKANPNVEAILKRDLVSGLGAATKQTNKGNYYHDKVNHALSLLSMINPGLVRAAAPNCAKLFQAVEARLG